MVLVSALESLSPPAPAFFSGFEVFEQAGEMTAVHGDIDAAADAGAERNRGRSSAWEPQQIAEFVTVSEENHAYAASGT